MSERPGLWQTPCQQLLRLFRADAELRVVSLNELSDLSGSSRRFEGGRMLMSNPSGTSPPHDGHASVLRETGRVFGQLAGTPYVVGCIRI